MFQICVIGKISLKAWKKLSVHTWKKGKGVEVLKVPILGVILVQIVFHSILETWESSDKFWLFLTCKNYPKKQKWMLP